MIHFILKKPIPRYVSTFALQTLYLIQISLMSHCLPSRARDCIPVSAQEGNNLSMSQMLVW